MSRIFSSAEPGPQLTWTAMSRVIFRCSVRLYAEQRKTGLGPLLLGVLTRAALA
jgi:hypothetical protein